MEPIRVTLPADVAQLLHERLKTDDPLEVSDAVIEAVYLWNRARDAADRHTADLRAAIQEGIDSGPGIPAEEVFAELRARIAARQSLQDAA